VCDGMGEHVDEMGLNLMNYYKILMNLHRKNLHPYLGLLLYPCIPLTTKQMQSIGWDPVASINHTKRYLVGFGCRR
jgi:hypothetical protein